MKEINIPEVARRTILTEANAIQALEKGLGPDFERLVKTIADSKGRLVVSGIGKSAIVAQKIVATLNSTGSPALFMHAADAIHGDLGMVQENDIVMVISKSGESPEIKVLIPLIRNFGNTLVAMTGNLDSYLAHQSNFILNTVVEQEACPHNLAPTTSTTAQMVMGDALAVCLMEYKGFGSEQFAKFHPGGMLGKKLYLRVGELSDRNEKPEVREDATLKELIVEISQKRLGSTAVVNEVGEIVGVVTDGDLRRMLEKGATLDAVRAADIMTHHPKTIETEALAAEALDLLRQYDITQLLVVNKGKYAGVIHLHDLIREGIM